MRPIKTWVATFDGASCRVFVYRDNARRLDELTDERRAGPHKPHFEDKLGRVHASVGARRSGMAPRTDPERRMEAEFVTALASNLAAKAAEGAFDQLIIAASPRALGAFRASAPKALADKVVRELHRAYLGGDEERLLAALAM
jgi:protein required for attachment to host cells